jgi:hypothetical protein
MAINPFVAFLVAFLVKQDLRRMSSISDVSPYKGMMAAPPKLEYK